MLLMLRDWVSQYTSRSTSSITGNHRKMANPIGSAIAFFRRVRRWSERRDQPPWGLRFASPERCVSWRSPFSLSFLAAFNPARFCRGRSSISSPMRAPPCCWASAHARRQRPCDERRGMCGRRDGHADALNIGDHIVVPYTHDTIPLRREPSVALLIACGVDVISQRSSLSSRRRASVERARSW